MFTIQSAKTLTLDEVCREHGFDRAELDEQFGVIEVDPRDHTYAVLADENAVRRVSGRSGVAGPFANPKIEPFGPPKTS
jgi:hypothetical protein